VLAESPVPLIYVNNTGVQNNGKNLVIFDGSSTVYNSAGDIALEVPPFFAGTQTFDLDWDMPAIEPVVQDDTTQLYQALHHGVKQFLWTMPPERRKMIIGLSGGIDSALAAAFYVDILGPENVFLYNLPTEFNSDETKSIAAQIAQNLGAHYEVVPIQGVVDAIAAADGCDPEKDELTYENIQARVRMEILAAKAQKLGGLFSCNGNKVEVAFGYGTMYGDIAGYLAAFGDLVKREVYQLTDYLNRVVYAREVIPRACFKIKPKAELKRDQKDPFDYGNLQRRGYHDEMVRAITEFRWNPEKFVEKYVSGKLEEELKLEPGTLKRLFPNVSGFLFDLEKCWRLFFDSVRKRVQAPPIPIVTKRSFGFDLRESMLSAHFTTRYHILRELALKAFPPQAEIAVFGGSFNPPGTHHQVIAGLLTMFDQVIVVPCGTRPDKPSANIVPLEHRKAMAELAFPEDQRIKLDLHDLEAGEYTPTYLLDRRYKELFPETEIWHVIGEDIIAGGHEGKSEIQRIWNRGAQIWETLNWVVLTRNGYGAVKEDLPPHHLLIEIDGVFGSGTLIRERRKKGQPIDDLVSPEVAAYIHEHGLYSE
jgi:nicotinate (nicotinamide) nucleotide adenylyltransferase